ncbi:MAG: hypothetical protein ACOZNI_13865 [Myxococcota bacterium]
MSQIVIVGASLAGTRAVEGLRTAGFDGDVVLVGADPELPYERPPFIVMHACSQAEPVEGSRHVGYSVRMSSIPTAFLDVVAIEEVPLERWREVFAAIGYPAGLTAENLSHDALADRLTESEPSEDLRELLQTIHDLGDDGGRGALQEAVRDRNAAPRGLYLDAPAPDLAVQLWLLQRAPGNEDAREVFLRAQMRVQAGPARRAFREYAAAKARVVHDLEAARIRLRERVRVRCASEGMGDYAEVRATRNGGRVHFQVLRGYHLQQPVKVEGGARSRIEFRPVHCDVIRCDETSGRIRIASRLPRMVPWYRQVLGEVLFDDVAFFAGDQICTLEPLQQQGATALRRHARPGLIDVRLTECRFEHGDHGTHVLVSDDCFAEMERLRLRHGEGAMVEAVLELRFAGRSTRKTKVTIKVPNRIERSRHEREAEIDAFLEEVGIRLGAPLEDREDLWSLAPWRHPIRVWRDSIGNAAVDEWRRAGHFAAVTLRRVADPDVPRGGPALGVEPAHDLLGVPTRDDLPVRTLTGSDVEGLELDVVSLARTLQRALGLEGDARAHGDGTLVELGRRGLGNVRCGVWLVARQPASEADLRAQLALTGRGELLVALVPGGRRPELGIPVVGVDFTSPDVPRIMRDIVRELRIEDDVPGQVLARPEERLVVDERFGCIWFDGVPVPIEPRTQAETFLRVLASARGLPVHNDELVRRIGAASRTDDQVCRQAKSKALAAIRQGLAAAGREVPPDLVRVIEPRNGTWRVTVPCWYRPA